MHRHLAAPTAFLRTLNNFGSTCQCACGRHGSCQCGLRLGECQCTTSCRRHREHIITQPEDHDARGLRIVRVHPPPARTLLDPGSTRSESRIDPGSTRSSGFPSLQPPPRLGPLCGRHSHLESSYSISGQSRQKNMFKFSKPKVFSRQKKQTMAADAVWRPRTASSLLLLLACDSGANARVCVYRSLAVSAADDS